jgi:uncharacterized FAD-dependent dehydrogenase
VALLISNVPWPDADADPIPALAKRLGVPAAAISGVSLIRRSLDARHRKQVWTAAFKLDVADEARILAKQLAGVRAWTARDDGRYGTVDQNPVRRTPDPRVRPIVVGAGPAGMFAALFLAESGIPVRLFDRGGPVEARVKAVNGYWQRKLPLDPENNILFGEGGAGTFSDGKIYTRRRDGELGYIFRKLVECGADPAILSDSFAHLGTDKVRAILPVFRKKLVDLGVDLRFGARVGALIVEGGVAVGVRLADGTEERGGPVILAAGHSARDTARMLVAAGAAAEARPIAIGARIEHPQALIDRASYGKERGELPAASYRLAFNPRHGRHAFTFCMCPGGMVVPAANDAGRVVVNGMSFAARRAHWANSAIIVQVEPSDYGAPDPGTPAALAGYDWQDRIERASYAAGGAGDEAPAQRFVDLVDKKASTELPKSSYPMGVRPWDLRDLLPAPVIDGMIAAIRSFDHKLEGFAGPEAVLIAPETRTTSPVRFLRDDAGMSPTIRDLYPIGEGAGYGGGIVSCALDGVRVARGVVAACG